MIRRGFTLLTKVMIYTVYSAAACMFGCLVETKLMLQFWETEGDGTNERRFEFQRHCASQKYRQRTAGDKSMTSETTHTHVSDGRLTSNLCHTGIVTYHKYRLSVNN
jgi:hypothetical protein